MLCSIWLMRCFRFCKVRVILLVFLLFLFVYRDVWLVVFGVILNIFGKSLRIGKFFFLVFWWRLKRVISGGLWAVKICWLLLVVRDILCGMWWLWVVSFVFMICCYWLICLKRMVLAVRLKLVVFMRYAVYWIFGLLYC